MLLPGCSQKYLRINLSVRESDCRKSPISAPFSYKTLDLQTKAVTELIYTQKDIAFVVVAPFNPFDVWLQTGESGGFS